VIDIDKTTTSHVICHYNIWHRIGLAEELGGHLRPHRTKSHKSKEVEQPYVIKFSANEGMQSVDIIKRLNEHYGDDALSRNMVYYWHAEVKQERTDLSNIASPGKMPDEGLASVIARRHEQDPHMSI
jgi:hypothetical protein